VADGKLLDFMDVMDICTVFGNALDNAIECAEKIPENEKRLIYVSVFSQKSFVVVRFENYYEGDLLFEGGLPATTKGDRNFHGYGIKSIKHVAEKYGGTVAIKTEKNWFELRIIIPLK
jgi:sensor histidine kinase regulating citrate/malate metabolism